MKELTIYLNRHGNERISNKHLLYINDLMKKNGLVSYGVLYKISSYIYREIKNGRNSTLNEIIGELKQKKMI